MENEGDAERKQAKVGEGSGAEGDGWGLLGQQAQENGEQEEHLPMNGVENSGRNAQDVMLADEDPTVYGLYFSLSFSVLCSTSLRFQWMANQCRSHKLERSSTT